jgi:hypothetical protein
VAIKWAKASITIRKWSQWTSIWVRRMVGNVIWMWHFSVHARNEAEKRGEKFLFRNCRTSWSYMQFATHPDGEKESAKSLLTTKCTKWKTFTAMKRGKRASEKWQDESCVCAKAICIMEKDIPGWERRSFLFAPTTISHSQLSLLFVGDTLSPSYSS